VSGWKGKPCFPLWLRITPALPLVGGELFKHVFQGYYQNALKPLVSYFA